jgi:protein-tyrosine phosphatase
MVRVLMVCLGNICRSPMAEAVFRNKVEEAGLEADITVASAGTGTWHLGEPPHAGTRAELARRAITLPGKQAQHVDDFDLAEFDYIVPMDRSNRRDLGLDVPLLLEYADCPGGACEVPDPYYDGGFDRVFELVSQGSDALLKRIVADRAREGGNAP